MKAKYIIVLFLVSLTFASCKNRSKIVTTTVTETTVTEVIDTVVTIAADTLIAVIPLEKLEKPQVFETEVQRTVVSFNPKTGNVTVQSEVKEREVPVEMRRTTVTKEEKKVKEKASTFPDKLIRSLWWKMPLALVLAFCIGYVAYKFT